MKPIAYRINSTSKRTGITLIGELKKCTILTTYDFIREELNFMNYKYSESEHYVVYVASQSLEYPRNWLAQEIG